MKTLLCRPPLLSRLIVPMVLGVAVLHASAGDDLWCYQPRDGSASCVWRGELPYCDSTPGVTCYCSRITTCNDVVPDGGTVQPILAQSSVFANVGWHFADWVNCANITVPGASCVGFAFSIDTSDAGSGESEAAAQPPECEIDRPEGVSVCALARTRDPVSGGAETSSAFSVCPASDYRQDCQDPTIYHEMKPIYSAGGSAGTSYTFAYVPTVRAGTWTSFSEVKVGEPTDGASIPKLTRKVFVLDTVGGAAQPSIAWQLAANGRVVRVGLIGAGIAAEGTLQLSGGAGQFTVRTRSITFDDQAMAVTGDGRFESGDFLALESILLLPPTDPQFLEASQRFDWNSTGSVDSDDVGLMESLVALGLDSRVFGDADNTGAPDCVNAAILWTSVPTILGNPVYKIALDFDLDGDVELDDWDQFVGRNAAFGDGPCFRYGDMNCDSFVSQGDLGAFVSALTNVPAYWANYPYCDLMRADMNLDGFVTVADIAPFVSCLTGGTCP